MLLQTKLTIPKQEPQIDYASKVVLIGSCFAQNITRKLEYYKFHTHSNPFGVIFNPIAIENLIHRAVNRIRFVEKDVFYHNERWQCFEVHSELSTSDKESYLSTLNEQLDQFTASLQAVTHLVFTFGTAWIYEHIATEKVVANCHKIPQKEFSKRLLSVAEIEQSMANTQRLIKQINPNVTCVYTVSPVRHIKDGIIENARSKAHLLTATHAIVDRTSKIENFYFPSFEIMMDELRDYRFYASDLIHPNETAIKIIWQKFCDVWLASETLPLQKKIAAIRQGLAHRPFNENSEGHQKFLKNLQQKISEVKIELSSIEF